MIVRLAACLRCDAVLTRDERRHYGRECHVCVVRSFELARLVGLDPDHPDRDWLDADPIDADPPSRDRTKSRAA